MRALQRPEFNLQGLRRSDLKVRLPQLSDAALSRQLHRLRHLKLIKRVKDTYRYYLTRLGRAAIAACCRLTEFVIVPALARG
ncbi:MAG: winged helix-turn-helix transcriptional regulator [Hyphomicrobiaceae bacterium]